MRRSLVLACWLVAWVAGCGDQAAVSVPDAGPTADAAQPDGAMPDAAPPSGDVMVSTHAYCCGLAPGPTADVWVVTVQPDGKVGDVGRTDAAGHLTLHGVEQGASITAVYPQDPYLDTWVTTYVDVAPGDHLKFGDDNYRPTPTSTGTSATITVPAYAGASYYYAYTTCGLVSSASTTLTVDLTTACAGVAQDIPLVVQDSGNNVVASARLTGATLTANATVQLAAWTDQTPNNFTTKMTNIGDDVTDSYLFGWAVLSPNADWFFGNYVTPSGGTASLTGTLPPVGEATIGAGTVIPDGTSGLGEKTSWVRGAGDETSSTFPAPTLPWVGAPIVNPTLGQALWLQTAGSYDAGVLGITYHRYDPVTRLTFHFIWKAILPPGQTSLAIGALPDALASYLPTSTDTLGYYGVQLVDLAGVTSYDDARAGGDWQLSYPDLAVREGVQSSASRACGATGCDAE